MMPVYRYPHQGNQVSPGPNYYPSFEAVPTLTKVDPSKTVVINQPWPYPNSFCQSMPCYPFSSDGHFPGYYSHGIYPHSPAPQFHYCGHYPPFPGAFPVQYMPPPCYLKELPRYDYDKPRDSGYHCCGCPDHSRYPSYAGSARMEEEEPKAGSKFGHSKVPFQLENYPYPVLWIPPEYMKNEDRKKPLESDGVTWEKSVPDRKPPQNVKPNEQEPKERHSWFPLDMKSLQPLLLGDDGKRTQGQQNEPPEYMKNEDRKKPLESDGVTWEKSVPDRKQPQNVKPNEQEPKERHSWFPLDMKSLQPLLLGDDGKRTQGQQNEERMEQFPFPIIWMPSHQKRNEDEKEEQGNMNGSPTIAKYPVPNNNVFPVKVLDNGAGTRKAQDIHDNVSDQVNSELKEKSANQRSGPVKQQEEKSTNQRSIPVKQMEDISANQRNIPAKQMEDKSANLRSIPVKQIEVFKEGENSEGAEKRGRAVSPKRREDHETGKASGAGARRGSSSPPKSKLPPVCLRVDPLPRKKSSSMSSRSPSPPGGAGKSQERTKEALKLPVMSDHKAQTYQNSEARENTLSSSKVAEEKKSKGAATEVAERMRDENKDEERRNDSETGHPVCSSVDSSDQTTQQREKNDVKSITEGDEGLESADGSEIKQVNEMQETNNESRFVEAAMERDKKKLSVDEAACRIQSAYRGYQVRRWEPLKKLKQIAEVEEQMGELRKKIHELESSLDLQKDEKLTTFIGEMIMRLLLKLDTIQGLHPSLRNVRKSLARELVMLQEKLDLLAKANSNEKPLDSEEEKSRDAEENPTDNIPHSVNAVPNNQDEETSKPSVVLKDEQTETVNDEQLVARDIEFPSNESEGEVDDGELDSTMVLEQDGAVNEETSQFSSDNLDNEGQSKLSDANGSPHMDNYAQVSDLEEPQAVISEDLVSSPAEQMGTDILEGQQNNEIDSSSTKVDESDTYAHVVEVLNELPVGLVEDAEALQHEQVGFPENVLLLDVHVGEKEAIDVPESQSTKETPSELEVSDLNEAKHKATLVLTAEAGGSYTSSVAMEISNQNDSEQQHVERFGEVAPAVGSMELMEVGTEDNNIPGKAMLEGDQQQTQVPEISNIVHVNESLQEETQQASPLLGVVEEMQTKVDQGVINPDISCISEAKNVTVSNLEEVKTAEDPDSLNEVAAVNVNVYEEREPREQETVDVTDTSSYQLDRPDISKDEGKREYSPILTATGELSAQEQKIAVEEGKKLVEENEKMREMVEKLVACGREQLAAISNLTGRVNDLENKLRRKTSHRPRRNKSRRCTPAITSPSHTPSTKPSPKKKPVSRAS